jgi:uncharacterized membrane protein YedE/YeeE
MTAPFSETGALGAAGVLASAPLIGFGFGWCLERGGLGSARKLTGQFYLTDLTVFKVMFSAILFAMLGAFYLAQLGMLDLSHVAVPETWLVPQLVGGLVFGAGMATAGLCPGTSCVAAASGRGDGLAVLLGMFTGVLVTGLVIEPLRGLYESAARGPLTLPGWLDLPYGVVMLAVVAIGLAGFHLAERVDSARAARAARAAGGTP